MSSLFYFTEILVLNANNLIWVYIWDSSWDYGTYHVGDQQRLRRACAFAQSPQSLHCSHTWSMEVGRVRPKIRHLAPLDGCACACEEWINLRRMKSTIISWHWLIYCLPGSHSVNARQKLVKKFDRQCGNVWDRSGIRLDVYKAVVLPTLLHV